MKTRTTHTVSVEVDLDDVTASARTTLVTSERDRYELILTASSDESVEAAQAKIDAALDRILAVRS